MKILLTTLLFFPEHYTGTEVLTYSTAKELQRLGHEVHVLTGFDGLADLQDSERFEAYEYDGIPVVRFHYAAVPMGGERDVLEMEYNNRFVGDWFRTFLKALQPDLVHVFHLFRLSASLIDVCHEAGVPVVVTPTDFWYVCPLQLLRLPDNSCCKGPDKYSLNCMRHLDLLDKPHEMTPVKRAPDWLLAMIVILCRAGIIPRKYFGFAHAMALRPGFLMQRLNSVAKVIIPSRVMERILTDNGLNGIVTVFSSFGLNLDHISSAVRRLGAGRLRVGFIGSLYEHKGIHVLLEAFRQLRADCPVLLNVYGENKTQPDFIASLDALKGGDARISFCGRFPNDRIGDILAEIDVLVVPSLWYENTPLVIYSAMAAGCPVIASDLGGMSEVVEHNVNGLLVCPGDPQELAKAIMRLVEERDLLERLSSGCTRPKSIKEYVSELYGIYGEVTKFALTRHDRR